MCEYGSVDVCFFPVHFCPFFTGFLFELKCLLRLLFLMFSNMFAQLAIYIYTNSVYKIYIMNVSELASNRIVSRFEFMFAIHTANPKKC